MSTSCRWLSSLSQCDFSNCAGAIEEQNKSEQSIANGKKFYEAQAGSRSFDQFTGGWPPLKGIRQAHQESFDDCRPGYIERNTRRLYVLSLQIGHRPTLRNCQRD